jgi:hypothetical protein
VRRVVGVVALVAIACSRPSGTPPTPLVLDKVEPAPTTSEITGKVLEVGSDPTTWLALQPNGGTAQVRLTGSKSTPLRAIPGAIVWITGYQGTGGFTVVRFEVRKVGEQDVDDGIVVAAQHGPCQTPRPRSATSRARASGYHARLRA